MPIEAQIAFIILTALFLLAFSVAREPRGWRRLVQSAFGSKQEISVNKNKRLDETLKSYGIIVAMCFLVADVGVIVWGVTYKFRVDEGKMSAEERAKANEMRRLGGGKLKAPPS
jgi:hypothetical protein